MRGPSRRASPRTAVAFVRPGTAGFTLVEILVALAILAVALMAASRAIGLSVGGAAHLQMVLLADWVAQNRLAQHRVDRDWPAIGTTAGEETQAGVKLRWQETVSGTPHVKFRRVEVSVRDAADEARELRRLVGYVSRGD